MRTDLYEDEMNTSEQVKHSLPHRGIYKWMERGMGTGAIVIDDDSCLDFAHSRDRV